MKNQMKRVSIGGRVQFDATGTGDWIVGVVTAMDTKTKKATVTTNNGEEIHIGKEHLFKVSEREFKQAVKGFEQAETSTATETPATVDATDNESEELHTLDDGKPLPRTIIKRTQVKHYVKTKVNGEIKVDCGDGIAAKLRGMELDEALGFIASTMDESPDLYFEKWGHLNPGQIRMNAGNRLRHWLKKQNRSL